MTINELINWIEHERQAQGLTQTALAARANMSERSLRRYLTRVRSRSMLGPIVKALGYQLQTDYVVHGKGRRK
jgi:transcriptional regulator with XRE-family HTH domain